MTDIILLTISFVSGIGTGALIGTLYGYNKCLKGEKLK